MTTTPEDSLEEIFKRVEEESERRAEEEHIAACIGVREHGDILRPLESMRQAKSRRRSSISFSLFGQVADAEPDKVLDTSTPPLTPRVSTIASQSAFYQAQAQNQSEDTLTSHETEISDDEAHEEDTHQVTQVLQIAGRGTMSKAVGGLRRLTRSRSANVLAFGDASVMIGISVEEATTEGAPVGPEVMVHAPGSRLRGHTSRLSISGPGSGENWMNKAKSFTTKFRRKRATTVSGICDAS